MDDDSQRTGVPADRPEHGSIDQPSQPPLVLPGEVQAEELTRGSMMFVGTATMLVRFGGFTFLTDPNFLHQGDHAPLGGGLRSRRLTNPAIELEELPPLDFVLLSHHHGDHFDPVVIERLPKDVPIVTTGHAARKLARQGFTRAVALRTWELFDIARGRARLRIRALPAKHAPQPLRTLLPPVMGSLLEFGAPDTVTLRVYVTGDTLFYDGIGEIARRHPDVDLCVIHLGGTRIAGILLTMDARQGVRALEVIKPSVAIPVHHDDYGVFKSPLADFLREAERARLSTTIQTLQRGESYVIGPRPITRG